MFTWVPFDQITSDHIQQMAEVLIVAPEAVRIPPDDLIRRLHDRNSRLFAVDGGGILVVTTDAGRLRIEVLSTSIFKRKGLAEALRRLAADWQCDTIETTVFDSRLADAIKKVGGQVESQTIILAVG